jgi:hypothetical protein
MRTIGLLAGLTAILCGLDVGLLLSAKQASGLGQAITFLFALGIAGGFVFFSRLTERCQSKQWIWIAFGLCGSIVLLTGPLRGLLPYGLQSDMRRFRLTFIYFAIALSLLPLLLKIASDLRGVDASKSGRK